MKQDKIIEFLNKVKPLGFSGILVPFVRVSGIVLLQNSKENRLVYKNELVNNAFYIERNGLAIKVSSRKRKIVLHGFKNKFIPFKKITFENVARVIIEYLFENREYIETSDEVFERYHIKREPKTHFDWSLFCDEVSKDIAKGLCPMVRIQYEGGNTIGVISENLDDLHKIKSYFSLFKKELARKNFSIKFNIKVFEEI